MDQTLLYISVWISWKLLNRLFIMYQYQQNLHYITSIFIDRLASAKRGDNVLGSAPASVRLFTLFRLKCLTFDLDFWQEGQPWRG